MTEMVEVGIVEVRMSGEDESPVVVLREAEGVRHLAIWMSAAGAAGILAALEPPDVDHPATHDLVVDLAELMGRRVEEVQIVGHQEGVFFSEILVAGEVLHHGQFLTHRLAGALESLRQAAYPALSLSAARVRMSGRDVHENHRVSTPLELLFDLTFVIAFGIDSSGQSSKLVRRWHGCDCAINQIVSFGEASFNYGSGIWDLDDDGKLEVVLDSMVFDSEGCLLNLFA